MANGPFTTGSGEGGSFSSTPSIGGGGGDIPPTASYLHSLELADATAWGNSQNTRGAFAMRPNGLEVTLQNGAAATINSMETAFGWSWPIVLVNDTGGNPLVAPENLGLYPTLMTILERSTSALPTSTFAIFGFCQGADASDSVGEGFACGISWESGVLRRTIGTARRAATTWTLVKGATGTNTCFGSRLQVQGLGLTGSDDCDAGPLDSGYLPDLGTTNVARVHTSNVQVGQMDHVFIAFGWSVAVAGTPTIRVDGGIQRVKIPWE